MSKRKAILQLEPGMQFGGTAAPRAALLRTFHSRRPIDKALINVVHVTVGASLQNTDLVSATFPCTVVGLRWNISVASDASTSISSHAWAIVILRDGGTLGTMAVGNGATLYAPEQDVMVWGRGQAAAADGKAQPVMYIGDTKTMRKLMGGDKLVFLCFGEATNTSAIEGCIQFFCKS